MISINFLTPLEMLKKIAEQAKEKRLYLNLSQKTLASMSGVSYGVLKKFERTGKISLESLLKLAFALKSMDAFNDLFPLPRPEEALSLDQLMQETKRERGRK